MEAPEKIWVHELSAMELDVPLKEYHIEYTRTDAFVEKACDWIEDHIYEYLRVNKTWHEPDYEPKLIEDFRKAMKGE